MGRSKRAPLAGLEASAGAAAAAADDSETVTSFGSFAVDYLGSTPLGVAANIDATIDAADRVLDQRNKLRKVRLLCAWEQSEQMDQEEEEAQNRGEMQQARAMCACLCVRVYARKGTA